MTPHGLPFAHRAARPVPPLAVPLFVVLAIAPIAAIAPIRIRRDR